MMSNSWKGMGRFGADPETRYVNTQNGSVAVVNFTLAVPNRKGVNPDTNWFRMEAWGSGGELIARHFHKGDLIDIADAEVRSEEWTDKSSGEKRTGIRFRVNRFDFVPTNIPKDKRESTESAEEDKPEDKPEPEPEAEPEPAPAKAPAQRRQPASRGRRGTPPPVDDGEDDSNIPF